jgi:hypothetical protein
LRVFSLAAASLLLMLGRLTSVRMAPGSLRAEATEALVLE